MLLAFIASGGKAAQKTANGAKKAKALCRGQTSSILQLLFHCNNIAFAIVLMVTFNHFWLVFSTLTTCSASTLFGLFFFFEKALIIFSWYGVHSNAVFSTPVLCPLQCGVHSSTASNVTQT